MDEFKILECVRLAQTGDREAMGQLVTELEGTVFAIVYRRLRNQAEAAEITQDVFVQVLRKLPQLREPERFLGWVRKIAVRMAINRAVRKPREVLGETATLGAVSTVRANPLERVLLSEEAHQVREGLHQLKELDRRTLEAFYIEGHSLQEMSTEFSSPIGTIKRRLHTARNRLRTQLAKLETVS